jgi:hypothetical protein
LENADVSEFVRPVNVGFLCVGSAGHFPALYRLLSVSIRVHPRQSHFPAKKSPDVARAFRAQ